MSVLFRARRSRPTPAVSSYSIASDDYEQFVTGTDLNGLLGGFGWGFDSFPKSRIRRKRLGDDAGHRGSLSMAYVDNYPGIGLGCGDNFESYSVTTELDGLNGGLPWFLFWGGVYVDRFFYLGIGCGDDMESYTVSAGLDGLNGGTTWFISWGGAYNDRTSRIEFCVQDNMETYTVTATLDGLDGGQSLWGGAYADR